MFKVFCYLSFPVISSLIVINGIDSRRVFPRTGSNVQVVCKSFFGKERCV